MNPATSVVLTGVIVTAGEWAKGEPVSIKVVVGGTVLAIGLSVMYESDPKLASQFATLVLLVAAFTYLPAVFYKLGLTKTKPVKWT
jgi:hypothetical protein